jgi:hypothetical protein
MKVEVKAGRKKKSKKKTKKKRKGTVVSMATPASRSQVLSLYRRILREGRLMPTQNRRDWVCEKTKREFREQTDLTDKDMIDWYIRYADTMLDQVNGLKSNTLFACYAQHP